MIEELITNSPAPNEMVLLNYKKIIIIIKRVRWPAVLSCDWWLDSVAAVTTAVCEEVGRGEPRKKKTRETETLDHPSPLSGTWQHNIIYYTELYCNLF